LLNLFCANSRLTARTQLNSGDRLNISEMEFLLINCTRKLDNVSSKAHPYVLDFHYNIPEIRPEIEDKLKYWENYKDPKPSSILFVIIDSVSRTHALRSLLTTVKYLTDELEFVDFKGYHCVGEPSSTNYIPMTLGILWEDLERIRGSMKGTYDNEPFVYKNYSQNNYLTIQIEDMAAYNVFNFNGRTGFSVKPYDIYLRPYILLQEAVGLRFGFSALTCMNGKKIFEFLLDYTMECIETFYKIPKYTTTYLTWPNHDILAGTRVMDNSFKAFFQKLKKRGVLDTTIVIVMADHGLRASHKFAESKYGLLERNLPLFMMRLPDQFIRQYPESFHNLRRNSERITSHFDLYKTVVHLHKLMLKPHSTQGESYGYNMKYGVSLLEEIPQNRTCADAKIPPLFCSCNFPLYGSKFEYSQFKKPLIG